MAKPALAALVPSALRLRLRRMRSQGRRLASVLGATNPVMAPQRRAVRRAAWRSLDRGDALDAYVLVSSHGLASVDRGTRRQLWQDLEQQGYLRQALRVAATCSPGLVSGRERLRRLGRLVAVLSGEFTPPVPSLPNRYDAHRGRVLHLVTNSLPRVQTGYTLRTHYTAKAQAAQGLDPHVVTQMGPGGAEPAGVTEGIDDIPYHRILGADRFTTPMDEWLSEHVDQVARLVQRIRPAVLHAASDYVNAMTATTIGRAYGIPVVYETRGFWEETWLSRQAQTYRWDLGALASEHSLPDAYVLRRDAEDRCRREADAVVVLSSSMVERVEAGGVRSDRIAVVPNAVDADAFPVLTRDRELADRYGIEDGTTVIGYISSLNEYEGVDTLLSAYKDVKALSSKPVRLLVVGDGDDRARLVQRAASLGLTDASFVGRVPHAEVLRYYSLIDVFVVPRRPVEVCHLVTPLKPYEAFATGRTVVLSNVRALAALAEESRAAALFEAGDAESLARALIALLEDPQYRRRLASTGAEWVRTHVSWAANALAYQRIYAELDRHVPGDAS